MNSREASIPQVSIVIPSYNHGTYIEETVASALRQDAVLELVVVDDGSTDDSGQRLQAIDDPRLQLTFQENRGAHAALKRGVEQSRGEIVFLLNSDDRFHPQRVARCLRRFAEAPQVDVLTSWIEIIDDHGKSLGIKEAWRNMPPWPRPRSGPGLADLGHPGLALLEANYVATTSNVAFRRRWWQEQGLSFAPLRYTHDWDMLLTAACRGTMEVLAEPLVSYRVHAENTLKEGQGSAVDDTEDQERGEGVMRFEILWTVTRHAHALLRRHAEDSSASGSPSNRVLEELTTRAWRSLPRFGQDDLLALLLQLRGDAPEPPKAFDDLLDGSHPLRRWAVERLSGS